MEALAGEGTVLVFLPGVGEIERLRERLSVAMPVQVLHGRLAGDAQAAVLAAPAGPRVVLATNVAETSVTIEGVTVVVDAGLERRPSYDPRRHRSRLVTRRIARPTPTSVPAALAGWARAAACGCGRGKRCWPGISSRKSTRPDWKAWCWICPLGLPGSESAVLAGPRRRRGRGGRRCSGCARWAPWMGRTRSPTWGGASMIAAGAGAGRAGGARPRRGPAASAARVAVLLSERMPGLDRQADLAERLRRFDRATRRLAAAAAGAVPAERRPQGPSGTSMVRHPTVRRPAVRWARCSPTPSPTG